MSARFLADRISRRVLAAVLLLALTGLASPARADLATFAKSKVVVETASGKYPFNVELALSQPQMMQGLMYRQSLAPDAGMLFDYGAPQPVAFWMKNTLIPLDMIFIGADGKVVDFHERAVPLSLDTIESKVPARAVLEVNGGTIARIGLKVGDTVHHAFFGNALAP
ncbi:MAG TPA: DUF192 domain-containing protein [Stellaceae bacterium]|nr:DUF192 domain-containing protein [Stellaceae bacterium]